MNYLNSIADRAESFLERIEGVSEEEDEFSVSDEEEADAVVERDDDLGSDELHQGAKLGSMGGTGSGSVEGLSPAVALDEGSAYDAAEDTGNSVTGDEQESATSLEKMKMSSLAPTKKMTTVKKRSSSSKSNQARQIDALEKELAALNEQLINMQQEVDGAHDALSRAKKDGNAREIKLKNRISELENAASATKAKNRKFLKEKDEKIKELEGEVEELNEAADHFEEDYTELEKKYKDALGALNELKEHMAHSSEMSEHGVLELQEQVKAAQNALEETKRDFSSQLSESEKRIAELESSKAELSRELVNMQRKIDAKEDASLQAEERSISEQDREARVLEAEEARQKAEALLAEERNRVFSMQQDLENARAEIDRTRSNLERLEARRQEEIQQHQRDIQALNSQLEQIKKRDDIQGVAALEQRLAALSEHLVAKQKQIELLTSEKGALRQRLKNLERQHEELKVQHQSVEASSNLGFGGVTPDVSVRFRRRQEIAARKISRLKPIADHPNLAEAVDVVDEASMMIGSTLRESAWARLGFLSYLFVLHLWAFFILLFHTHQTITVDHSGSANLRGTNPI